MPQTGTEPTIIRLLDPRSTSELTKTGLSDTDYVTVQFCANHYFEETQQLTRKLIDGTNQVTKARPSAVLLE